MIQKSESALTVFGDNSRKRFHPIVVAVILECIQNPPSSHGKLIIDTNLQMDRWLNSSPRQKRPQEHRFSQFIDEYDLLLSNMTPILISLEYNIHNYWLVLFAWFLLGYYKPMKGIHYCMTRTSDNHLG